MTCVYAPVSGTIACFDDLRQAFEDSKNCCVRHLAGGDTKKERSFAKSARAETVCLTAA